VAVIPQAYPLWLAEKRDVEIRAGRILGWRITESIEKGLPGPSASNPIVAFTTQEGLLMEIDAPQSPLVFVADTREEALAAARQLAAPTTGFAPQVDDEVGDSHPPDARSRVQARRRPTLRNMTTEPSSSDAGPEVPPARRRSHTAR